jgi:hypothetical protein
LESNLTIIAMIKTTAVIICFMLVFALGCNNPKSSVYYIDFVSGNDSNSGKSAGDPWKTAKNVSSVGIIAGDQLLFKGGVVYSGEILLESLEGLQNCPIVIAAYGEGQAIIDAGNFTGIGIRNSENIVVKNFIIRGNGRLNGNIGNGLIVQQCNGVKIDSVEVSGFMWSGVNIIGGSDIDISHVYAHDNGFCGIYAEPIEKEYGSDGSKFKTLRNLRIAWSVAENNPGCPLIKDNHSGNGILIGGVVNGVIEYCEAMNNGWDMPRDGNGPVGIWAYMCDSIVIQHCYSHHNKTSEKGKDGGGFDFDGGITNSVMQYNISAFNEGAGYGIFQYAGATDWENNTLMYNISYNDGAKNGQAGIFMWYDPIALPMKNFNAYNNTIVSDQQYGINFEPGNYSGFVFSNNILLLTGNADRFIGGLFEGALFRNNNYWSVGNNAQKMAQPLVIYDKTPLVSNPELILPENAKFSPEMGNFKHFPYFRISSTSPCRGGGISLAEKADKDFWGKVPLKNIGADNGSE